MTRRLLATAAVLLALLVGASAAEAWTLEDCIEVNYDHPDCDQYGTTTTSTTATTSSTTSQPEVTTTSTTAPETSTTVPVATTQPFALTTTTTIDECPAGTVHQPPLCVVTTVPFFDTTTTVAVGTALTIERLPHTGDRTALLAAVAGVLGLGGFGLVTRNRKASE